MWNRRKNKKENKVSVDEESELLTKIESTDKVLERALVEMEAVLVIDYQDHYPELRGQVLEVSNSPEAALKYLFEILTDVKNGNNSKVAIIVAGEVGEAEKEYLDLLQEKVLISYI